MQSVHLALFPLPEGITFQAVAVVLPSELPAKPEVCAGSHQHGRPGSCFCQWSASLSTNRFSGNACAAVTLTWRLPVR